MSRSIKKGPYVEAALLKKVEALNAANKKLGADVRLSSHKWLNTQLLFITAKLTYLSTFLKIWSDIS